MVLPFLMETIPTRSLTAPLPGHLTQAAIRCLSSLFRCGASGPCPALSRGPDSLETAPPRKGQGAAQTTPRDKDRRPEKGEPGSPKLPRGLEGSDPALIRNTWPSGPRSGVLLSPPLPSPPLPTGMVPRGLKPEMEGMALPRDPAWLAPSCTSIPLFLAAAPSPLSHPHFTDEDEQIGVRCLYQVRQQRVSRPRFPYVSGEDPEELLSKSL